MAESAAISVHHSDTAMNEKKVFAQKECQVEKVAKGLGQ
jgi:hypothetical protein